MTLDSDSGRAFGDDDYIVDSGSVDDHQQPDWLAIARAAYQSSTNYFDSSIRRQVERNYALASGRHPTGSKYHTESYKYRSKIFRNKTRAAIRKNEAAASIAYFSTEDIVKITAENESDEDAKVTAKLVNGIMNHHLAESIPWFKILIGGVQDAQTPGVVFSKQYWDYAEESAPDADFPEVNDVEPGEFEGQKFAMEPEVISDKPVIELIPIENIRIDPGANWLDPINSSPYVIIIIPMYRMDVKKKMEEDTYWFDLPVEEIRSTTTHDNDTTRLAREGTNRQDTKDVGTTVNDFDIVWVHENFVRYGGKENVYYTLGTEKVISEIIPLEIAYPHCAKSRRRPIAFGQAIIESHKIFTSGMPQMVEGSQIEANDIVNQRNDFLKLILNRRYYASRTGNVDYRSLTRAVPGSVTLMDDPRNNVIPEQMADVPNSAFAEQDRTNMDFDELSGTFSVSSVGSSRQLNETVGGMNLLSSNANVLQEYLLRTINETWVEDVMRQVKDMVQTYESNADLLQAIGQGLGIENPTPEMLTRKVKSRVGIGFGATNPVDRVNKLMMGVTSVSKIIPQVALDLDGAEVIKEIFGSLGYKDGSRFFKSIGKGQDGQEGGAPPDPIITQLQQELQKLQRIIETKQIEQQGRLQAEEIKSRSRLEELITKIQAEREIKLTQMALDRDLKVEELTKKAGIEESNHNLRVMQELSRRADILDKRRELTFKMQTGRQGI